MRQTSQVCLSPERPITCCMPHSQCVICSISCRMSTCMDPVQSAPALAMCGAGGHAEDWCSRKAKQCGCISHVPAAWAYVHSLGLCCHSNTGPGRYGGDASTSTMEFQHDSVGKRGYGPMASRDKRFKHHKLRYTGPGPGEYEQNIADFIATNFNRAATTANFHTEVWIGSLGRH